MIKAFQQIASACRFTPRQPPLSLVLTLTIWLLCAASPVASEQPRVMSAAVAADAPQMLFVNHAPDTRLDELDDAQLKGIRGRHATGLKLDSHSDIAVILWDEVKSGSSRTQLQQVSGNNNLQSNSVTYSK